MNLKRDGEVGAREFLEMMARGEVSLPGVSRADAEVSLRQIGANVGEVELPIPVAPDWDEMVRRSTQMTRLIDRHLDYERRGRTRSELMPAGLCPEQRVNLITDMVAVSR